MQQQTTGWDPATSVSEQASGVYFAEGPASNWTVVRDGTGYILIDSGYPDDRRHVLASLHYLGLEPADALALVVTHGHVDHTGSAAFFSESYGTPVLCAPGELAHVQGKEKHQVTLGQVLSRAWRPCVFRWMVHAIRAGALAARPATRAEAWDAARLRTLPGRPVALSVPGHTPGNAAILLPEARAIVVGDSFVSGHPISRTSGPQMLPAMYHSDPGAAFAALRNLAGVDASVVLPGHGPALRIPLAEAVGCVVSPSRTRSRAARRTRQDGPRGTG
ncbi:MBL fold metallo-hydrolase [Pseudarthrobacter sp. BRE9]|uniref:MBL fold metallo-hydrolase n=1 Tax=Pseudarthrobacter sp. BRE9 TaxID=2962582 RepID=UPI00288229AA|nr:MBL fold metallo-hydrolase [Pseudarthrobacter sp. BRE9]MDT0168545.1 MBL fold metallo-hydrolase [Pseudarthrobacter sp. BRE9]